MFEPQNMVDLGDNSGFGDSKSWLSGDINNGSNSASPTHLRNHHQHGGSGGGNVDRVLYNDLVGLVPLVESLIERKASSSFTRRGSMVYTKTPSRESLYRKVAESKGRNLAQSIPSKKRRDPGDKEQRKNGSNNTQDAENFSMLSSRGAAAEKETEELTLLRGQVEDLQRQLMEKDELLKSNEITQNQINSINAELDELRREAREKDSLIKSIQLQLSDAKIKLADKQAALEKTRWEAMTSAQKVEKLLEELDSMHNEVSSFMVFFDGLTKNEVTEYSGDYDVTPYYMEENIPSTEGLGLDSQKMLEMEEARLAYISAVATAKEKQDEVSLVLAAKARLHLQSFVFGTACTNGNDNVLDVKLAEV